MLLRIINEAAVSDSSLITALKSADEKFKNLKDGSVQEIINTYRKKVNKDVKEEEILNWAREYPDFALFVIDNFDTLSTYVIYDLAENDEKLSTSIRKYLRDLGIINDNDEDLITSVEGGKRRQKLDLRQLCSIIFDEMSEVAKNKETIPTWAYRINSVLDNLKRELKNEKTEAEIADAVEEAKKAEIAKLSEEDQKQAEEMLKKAKEALKVTKDLELQRASVQKLEQIYHSLYEGLEDICPKCGKKPCECKLEEAKEEEEVEEEETLEEVPEEIPEEEIKVEAEVEEPVEVPSEVTPIPAFEKPSQSMIDSAHTSILNNLVQRAWSFINDVQSAIVSLGYEDPESQRFKDIEKILESIIDDCTVDVGMLYKALELISTETSELIAAGTTKAEETID